MLKLGDYSNFSDENVVKDIIESYQADPNLISKFEILIAERGETNYDGFMFFVLRNKETGQLHYDHDCYCVDCGFIGEFHPKETTVTYLKSKQFSYTDNEKVKAFIESL